MRLLARLPRSHVRRLAIIGAILIYLAAAYLLVGRGLLGNFSGRIASNGAGRDPTIMIWCLAWFPHALHESSQPVSLARSMVPGGINLAWVTTIPVAATPRVADSPRIRADRSFNALSFLALPAARSRAFLCAVI